MVLELFIEFKIENWVFFEFFMFLSEFIYFRFFKLRVV